jgi:hypothetical protein
MDAITVRRPMSHEDLAQLRSSVTGSSTLTALHLGGCSICSAGCEVLCAALGNLSALTALTLSSNSLGDNGAKSLGGVVSMMPALTSLHLVACEIGPAGCTFLSDGVGRSAQLLRNAMSNPAPSLVT